MDYRQRADTASFRASVKRFASECACERAPVIGVPGAAGFLVPHARANGHLLGWVTRYRHDGVSVFRYFDLGFSARGDAPPDKLILLPTADQFEAVRAAAPSSIWQNLDTPAIIRWLKRLNATHPFTITGADSDSVLARFTRRPQGKDAEELARLIYRFAPDNVDQGSGSVADLRRRLERTGVLDLWWDD
jgi:hypothetical protein